MDVDAVPVVVAGTGLWALGLVMTVVLHEWLEDSGRGWWVGACAWGVALGLIGLWHTRRRRAAIARAEAREADSHVA
jgi:hypothetical protein